MRKTEFANEEYYHIYNRGVDKREVLLCKGDYVRFLRAMDLLNDEQKGLMLDWRDLHRSSGLPKAKPLASQRLSLRKPLVELIFYCLNPNHFHFSLKQLRERGIQIFMQRLGTSYTMYFNKKYSRSSSLFQGPFKSIHINSNEYLLYLSAYVNKNYFIHGYGNEDWKYSSLLDYIGKRNGSLCNKEVILGQFGNNFSEYEKYLKNNAELFKENKAMEKYILE